MKEILFIAFFIFSIVDIKSQDIISEKFIKTFEEIPKEKIRSFGFLLNNGKEMSRAQAIEYIYKNDSSKLYCKQESVSMETEVSEGIFNEEYIPRKCLRFSNKNFILLGYSSYECREKNEPVKALLTLLIINPKNYKVKDSLIVYIGDEYDWTLTGLFNPMNGRIFTLKELGKRTSSKTASIYKINNDLKFEVVKNQSEVKNMTDNLQKDIELLNWSVDFYTPQN